MENNPIASDFFQIMTYSYCPTIFRATRITSYTATLIDNCFMNNYEHSAVSGILITDISDHLPILHISDLKARNSTPNSKYVFSRLINKDKIESFKSDLGSLDWQTSNEPIDPNIAYNNFLNKFKYFYDKNFPLKKL